MEKLKAEKVDIKYDLKGEYKKSLEDSVFKELVTKLNISEKLGSMNNSNLQDSVLELKNCSKCKGLFSCQNKYYGHYLYPKMEDGILDFNFIPCKYKKDNDRLVSNKNTASRELLSACFKNIDINDKKRVALIKWLKEFYDEYDGIKDLKGLYLHGAFGSGKTYLIYALLNELRNNKHTDYIAVYYPTALRELKEDWDSFGERIDNYANTPLLLIDDIGAEIVSDWSRDEVLGTILQYRMNNHLTTFFTSNLSLSELEEHLASTKIGLDRLKARRIMERIKYLTVDFELITDNKRK